MRNIPLFKPFISDLARSNVQEVLSGTQLAEGPRVEAFEKAFSALYGLYGVIALNSGSSALEMALHLCGVGEDDEIIVPVLGHPANCLPAVHRGARVTFADIRMTLTMDANDLREKCKKARNLKAIVYVHFGGSDATLRECKEVADHYGVPLIEDAAQCGPDDVYGLGEYTCFSLQSIKLLTAGDGGMLACKSPNDAARAKRLRWFGFDRTQSPELRDIEEAGWKWHMNDITAAIGHGNLDRLEKEVLLPRRDIESEYIHSGLPLLQYSWLTILVHEKAMAVQKVLKENGVGCGQQHYRMDRLSVFGGKAQDLPTMNTIEMNYLMLPFHHGLVRSDVEYVISLVKTALVI